MSASTAVSGTRFPAMGSEVTVLGRESLRRRDVEAVKQLFWEREAALSRFHPTSELSRLNARAGTPMRVSAILFDAVVAACRAARATNGAFDPTLGRQIVSAGYARSFGIGPAVTRNTSADSGGGWREVMFDYEQSTVMLPAGVALDLGGIAKGMAVDAAVDVLEATGVKAALVSAGGDLRVIGSFTTPGWLVALEDTADQQRVTLTTGALATSSISRRRWVLDGVPMHHLLDPGTGRPARSGLRSVTVSAPTCEQAEVAAKAAFVLGRKDGTNFLEAHGLHGVLTPLLGSPAEAGGWPRRRAA